MNKKELYILMHQEEEVLSFEVSFSKEHSVKIIERLAHIDKAPFKINSDASLDELNDLLFYFLNNRTIAINRWDYQEIISNTGVKDGFELLFKGHGLTLSDHYWFKKENETLKYSDINFFTNKWDDSFARAVLKGNYQDLKNVDLNVPDITTRGWAVKGWLYEDGPKLYKLGIDKEHYEDVLGEVLASKLAKRMFGKGEFLEHELKEVYGKYASVSSLMLDSNEELVPLSHILSGEVCDLFYNKNINQKNVKEFIDIISHYDIPELDKFFIKLFCFRSLSFVNDLHFNNICVIRNIKTGNFRVAPLFDLGGSFGSSSLGRSLLSNINKATFFMVYYIFGGLDPNWDYSWYKKESLIGFEDEIKTILSKSDFYTPEIINNITEVYKTQKAYLDDLAK